MRAAIFCHSLVSDWNHGNAHFLRGVCTELIRRGHEVKVFEPAGGWSRSNLTSEHGEEPVRCFHAAYPLLQSTACDLETLDLDQELDGVDMVIVHEWNTHALVRRVGEHRAKNRSYRLFFHDTHHRSATDPQSMAAYDLRDYDGVLAFGCVIRDLYLQKGWTAEAWTWHEAADTAIFRPLPRTSKDGDLIWIGNWGDEERSRELQDFLLEPVCRLGLQARIHGVRYPDHARKALAQSGIEYAGWLANFDVPRVFSSFEVTVHIPRRPYVEALPGIPTIRVFEALACGIPLVCSPWQDSEQLFRPGRDYLTARDGEEMTRLLQAVLKDREMSQELASQGRRTILEKHTCAHRVDQLLAIYAELNSSPRKENTSS